MKTSTCCTASMGGFSFGWVRGAQRNGKLLTTDMEMEKVYHRAIRMPLINEALSRLALARRCSSLAVLPSLRAMRSSTLVFLLFRLFRLERCCCVKPVSSSSSSPSSECMSSSSQSELDRGWLSVSALEPLSSSPSSSSPPSP